MTGTELLTYTAGIMGMEYSTLSVYSDTIKLSFINTVLQQTFNLENNVRAHNGTAVLTTRPVLTALSETLTYQDAIVRNVLPNGIAQLIALADDETIRAGFFSQRYEESQRLESFLIASDVTDYYTTYDSTDEESTS
jgi:hypothetical protein